MVKALEHGSVADRTAAMAIVTESLKDEGIIKGWRGEMVPVISSFSSPLALTIERAAYPYFGLKGYGVHINGYVRGISGNIEKMWVAVRSKTKSTWPGMLDHVVAGGIVQGYRYTILLTFKVLVSS